ncbi:T-lymphocyte activation antigen CD86 [Octodon degus]|uniref:T-lymphocyte activation antigen CD86 n=1 Tax=Octodon degus TaxID=10160 RepID=A0A6P6DD45_OCTDE|nr:T-lymphocyte activation antigen CD86 [Octodon degus]
MGAGDSTMGPVIILILMSVLYSGAVSLRSEAYFNETAELPCQFSNSQNLSLNELVIFWQDQEKLVLYEHYLGKENFNNVNSKYKHRTSFDHNNWTLRLHRAQIKDEGVYQCIIHHKRPTGLVSIHQKDSELSLFANFTQPEIVQMSNITGKFGINLTCSSGQGYPKAMTMYFLVKLENSTELEYDCNMQTSQNNGTELYNVSISKYFPFPDGMSNMTIFCVLKTKAMKSEERELRSKPFCRVPNHPVPVTHQPFWIIIASLISVIFSAGVVYFAWKKKKKQRAVLTNKESTKTEKEKNEGTGQREKIQVPERNDKEVQCT